MTQLFKVLLDGVSVTKKVVDVTINESVGSIFNTAIFKIAGVYPELYNGANVQITHGDHVFNGFVLGFSKVSRDSYTVSCRSNGGRLSEPFFTDTERMSIATDAIGLCAEFAYESGVQISYISPNISFGGAWISDGTPDAELMKLANITGADIYDDGTGIVIEPVKAVSGSAEIIEANEIIDFAVIEKSIMNNNLGIVITKTEEDTTSSSQSYSGDVIAYNTINFDIKEDESIAKIYISPFQKMDDYDGFIITKYGDIETLIDSQMMNGDTVIGLTSAIKSIVGVTLNGIPITNYKYKLNTNVVYFDTPQYGELRVQYETRYHLVSMEAEYTPAGNFSHIMVKVGENIKEWSGFVRSGASLTGGGITDDGTRIFGGDDNVSYYSETGFNSDDGFLINTFGDSAVVELYSGSELIDGAITESPDVVLLTEVNTVTLLSGQVGVDPVYGYSTDYTPISVVSVRDGVQSGSDGVSVSFTVNEFDEIVVGEDYGTVLTKYYASKFDVTGSLTSSLITEQLDSIDDGGVFKIIPSQVLSGTVSVIKDGQNISFTENVSGGYIEVGQEYSKLSVTYWTDTQNLVKNKESATVEMISGNYGIYPDYPIGDVIGVYSNGQPISYTTAQDSQLVDYIQLDGWYSNLQVNYSGVGLVSEDLDYIDAVWGIYTDFPVESVSLLTSNGLPIDYTIEDGYIGVDSKYPNVEVEYYTTGEEFYVKYDSEYSDKVSLKIYPDGSDPDEYDSILLELDDEYIDGFGYGQNNTKYFFYEIDTSGGGEPNYVTGFAIYCFGEEPDFELYSGITKITTDGKITQRGSVNESWTIKERANIQNDDSGRRVIYTGYQSNGIVKLTSNGIDINYSESVDDYGRTMIVLDDMYPQVDVYYNLTCRIYDLQYAENLSEEQTLIIICNETGDRYEIPLQNSRSSDDWYDPSNIPCSYPQDFPFNIPELLDLKLNDCIGKSIQDMGTVGDDGFIFVTITQDGLYEWDASSLKPRTTITLRANVNGSLE